MNWREHITVDPAICHGKACIVGTRVLVSVILDNLADGMDTDEIVSVYPTVPRDAIKATLLYAAELARREQTANGHESTPSLNRGGCSSGIA